MKASVLIAAAFFWLAPALASAELLEVRQSIFGMD